MQEFILFLMCFVFVFIIYQIFIVSKAKKNHISKKKKDREKQPIEVRYLIFKYHIDLEKASYNQLLQVVALVSAFDISLIVTLTMLIDEYLFQLLLAVVIVIPIILVSYHFVGRFYQKKGMVKNV